MAQNKKQHYVPQFYLRHFSTNSGATHVGVMVKSTSKIVRNALIKNQAYEDYFYGAENDIEKGFSKLEGEVSRVIATIKSTERLPVRNSEEFNNLLLFTLFQGVRTKSYFSQTDEMINALFENILKSDKRFEDDAGKYEIAFTNPAASNLQAASEGFHIASDLECKLLINISNTPFISSDHPVASYNQFLEIRNHPYYGTGLATKGLQMFFPLTPKLMLLLYDSRVYKIKNRRRDYFELNEKTDIIQLNKLQFANSDEVIFFNNHANENEMIYLNNNLKYIQSQSKVNVSESAMEKRQDGKFSKLVHVSKNDTKIGLKLSFMKLTDYAKAYKWSEFILELRDENMRKRENRRSKLDFETP